MDAWILNEVRCLKRKIDQLESQCTPLIATACTASGCANGADPFPLPAISVSADISIMVGLSTQFANIYSKGIEGYDLASRIGKKLGGAVISQGGKKIAAKAYVQNITKQVTTKCAEFYSKSFIAKYFAKSAAKTTANAQLKWIPILGQMAAGAAAATFMSFSAKDIRRMYSDLYYEKLRECIYHATGRSVPQFRLKISKTGMIYKVWCLEAIDRHSGKCVVKINRDYGATGNKNKAIDFYKAVTAKGYVFNSNQTNDIASKMWIDSEFYKPYQAR